MTEKFQIKINVSELSLFVNSLISDHSSKLKCGISNDKFTLARFFSMLTDDEFGSLQRNRNFNALFDLFELEDISTESEKNVEDILEDISLEKLSDSNMVINTKSIEQDSDRGKALPHPDTLLKDAILELPDAINKLITRLRNVSDKDDGKFRLGKYLRDVISLNEFDILNIDGIGNSYANSLKQLHELYENFDTNSPHSLDIQHDESNMKFDLSGLEIVRLGMNDDEVNFIETLINQNHGVLVAELLNLDFTFVASLPLMGPTKRNGFKTLRDKLLLELRKIESGSINLERYESKLIRDSRVEELDIATLDKIILEDLEEFLTTLSARDGEIFQSRLGFISQQMTLEELGIKYDIERERVRQIEKKYRDKFTKSMRINSEKIWMLIFDKLDSSLSNYMLLTYDPFDTLECFYDFLSYISGHDELREFVLPKSVRMGILDECFGAEGDLSISIAEEYLEEYSKSIGTSPSNILDLLVQNGKIKRDGNCFVPVKLPKKEAVAYILSRYEKGLPWMDVSNLVNSSQIGYVLNTRLDPNAFDSEYVFQSDRGKYKHINHINLKISVDYIFSSLKSYLAENGLSGIHVKEWHDHSEDQIKLVDYYELRSVLRSYAKDYGYYFDGKSGRDNISNDLEYKSVTQRDIILRKMIECGKTMTKQEIARLIRSNSLNHASLYLKELAKSGHIVQVDLARYTTPEIAFNGIDLEKILGACKKFCVNATEQVSDRIFECDHQTQS